MIAPSNRRVNPQFEANFASKFFSREAAKNAKERLVRAFHVFA
jgi:hypothetical protein